MFRARASSTPSSAAIPTRPKACQITHAFNVEGAGIKETKTPNIAPGQSATVTVDATKAGSLEFYCPIDGHKAQGMKGELKVGSGGGGSSSSSKSGGGGGGGGSTSGY